MPESTKSSSQSVSRGAIWTVLIILGFIVLIVIIVVAIRGSFIGNVANNGNQSPQLQNNCRDVQVAYNDTEYTTVSEPYTNNVCDAVNMIYKESYTTNKKDCIQQECVAYNQVCSQWNFWRNCVAYTNGNCTNYKCDKYQVSCGMKIENQEKQPLTYPLNLESYNYDTKQASVVRVQDVYVAPLDSQEYLWDFTALPTDNLGCIFADNSAPTMQNCQDVIKYHDVQKTLIVTKYKTEQQCN